jgi:hypothetical protein
VIPRYVKQHRTSRNFRASGAPVFARRPYRRTLTNGTTKLRRAGFRVERTDQPSIGRAVVRRGRVINVHPPGGTRWDTEFPVQVVVSSGRLDGGRRQRVWGLVAGARDFTERDVRCRGRAAETRGVSRRPRRSAEHWPAGGRGGAGDECASVAPHAVAQRPASQSVRLHGPSFLMLGVSVYVRLLQYADNPALSARRLSPRKAGGCRILRIRSRT